MNEKKLLWVLLFLSFSILGSVLEQNHRDKLALDKVYNQGPGPTGEENEHTYKNLVYIPILNNDMDRLFSDVDHWISAHNDKDIISVDIIDATLSGFGSISYTTPSGAIIVFRDKK